MQASEIKSWSDKSGLWHIVCNLMQYVLNNIACFTNGKTLRCHLWDSWGDDLLTFIFLILEDLMLSRHDSSLQQARTLVLVPVLSFAIELYWPLHGSEDTKFRVKATLWLASLYVHSLETWRSCWEVSKAFRYPIMINDWQWRADNSFRDLHCASKKASIC